MPETDRITINFNAHTEPPEITPAMADAALHLFRQNGREPGHFFGLIMRAIAHADEENIEHLRSIYPGWVRAYEMGARETYGINRLREIAETR